ncbi:hypothetical protein [Quadrisphaera sp. KR29]|uniref:hypothetical protein n=1 Tax=Quadrisphaera sp. KR29 TaxID=3461391 RepID=UPI0040440246
MALSVVVLLACAAGVSGCSSSGAQLTLDDGTSVFVGAKYSGAVPAIGVPGTIVRLDGDCWGLDDGGSTPKVLVLEHGTTVSEDGRGVVTPDGVELHVGDDIYGGSGGGGISDNGLVEQWRKELPACFARRGLAAVSFIDPLDS